MLATLILFLLPSVVFSDVTFRNVEFKGYSVFVLKFTKTITRSDTLQENLPKKFIFDHLEIVNQDIPVLKENSVSDIEGLDELTIEKCNLERIEPNAFRNIPDLRKLSLKGNKLEEIKEGVFNNMQVSMLDLSGNMIKMIEDKALNNMPKLMNIHLADNFISEWNKRWFFKVPLLARISMQNNSLQEIPAFAFTNIKGNKKFGSVKLTINLIFSHNKIRKIDDNAFNGLECINNLWMDYNNLTDFSENLLEKISVEDLRIDHNQITCLKGDLGKIVKAKTTHMDGNPFECFCVENIKKWAQNNHKTIDIFNADMDCVVKRLRKKMTDLERRLKEEDDSKDVEEVTPKSNEISEEVELIK